MKFQKTIKDIFLLTGKIVYPNFNIFKHAVFFNYSFHAISYLFWKIFKSFIYRIFFFVAIEYVLVPRHEGYKKMKLHKKIVIKIKNLFGSSELYDSMKFIPITLIKINNTFTIQWRTVV